MELHTLGINYKHDENFLIDRPDGSGDDLILFFKTAAVVWLDDERISVQPDSAIVYRRGFRQRYGADGTEYINHWVHFEYSDGSSFAQRTGLPFNTVIPVKDMGAAEDILSLLSVESVSNGVNRNENTGLLLRLLLSKLAEGAEQGAQDSVHSRALRELRASIHQNPAAARSISSLAGELSLSPSHFQYLYKREFGISCYEDMLAARLEMAKYYLRSTELPIRQIAELCGYENDVHFIRQFRKRTGFTAGEFRRNSTNLYREER